MRQAADPQDLVNFSVRVPRETADKFRAVADANYRPVAAELRRLIEERVAEPEPEREAA